VAFAKNLLSDKQKNRLVEQINKKVKKGIDFIVIK